MAIVEGRDAGIGVRIDRRQVRDVRRALGADDDVVHAVDHRRDGIDAVDRELLRVGCGERSLAREAGGDPEVGADRVSRVRCLGAIVRRGEYCEARPQRDD